MKQPDPKNSLARKKAKLRTDDEADKMVDRGGGVSEYMYDESTRKKMKQNTRVTSNLPSVTYPGPRRMKTKPQIYKQESWVPGMSGRKGTYIGDVNG